MTLPLFEEYRDFARKVPLSRGKFAVVDEEDFERVSEYQWHAQWSPHAKTFYGKTAYRDKYRTLIVLHLHRFVLGTTNDLVLVDHRDHDGLNCRKLNLRECDKSQNAANGRMRSTNTSGYKGVSFYPQSGKWRAIICLHYKNISLGLHVEKIDAARAYDQKAIELFGEFAHLNFPRSDYESTSMWS